jgi:monoamine oxidase
MKPSNASHSPLFAALRRLMRTAAESEKPSSAPHDELLDMFDEKQHAESRSRAYSRRDFMALTAGAGVTALASASLLEAKNLVSTPKVVIVGGGVAGLNAAYTLKKNRIIAPVYDANTRVGGRMYTGQNICGQGLYAELGGEFIDTSHLEIRRLCREFGLTLRDRHIPAESRLKAAYFFDGQHHSERQVIEAFRPIARRMLVDINKLSDEITSRTVSPDDMRLDMMSMAAYLDSIGCTGWFRKLLDAAFISEYGLETDQLSSIAMLYLISADTSKGFEIFGESDERFKVAGGNERVTIELHKRVRAQIHLEHRLEAIRQNAGGDYTLTFDNGGTRSDVTADVVLLTLPFTMLREVDTSKLPLPEWKRNAIQNLSYGPCAKLFFGVNDRLWRKSGYSGEIFSDQGFQLAWDNSMFQPGKAGGVTMYFGGDEAIATGQGTPAEQIAKRLPAFDQAFPGAQALFNGTTNRFHWPSFRWTKMAYAAYSVGQFTNIAGLEFEPVGNIHFAGEHTSLDSQGYMEGGAETGKRAAQAVLRKLK